MARNLFAKGDSITLPPPNDHTMSNVGTGSRPRTAIGGMAQFVVDESRVRQELELLRSEHAQFDGAKPVRQLDPRTIRPSEWANRHEDSFRTEEFLSLRAEIENAGGNIQPIKVRPLRVGKIVGPVATEMNQAGGVEPFNPPCQYEIVFGHRRHRACLDLGIFVLAMVEDASEQELFIGMDRENRLRADLSPWEQGMMYVKALDKGLFSSNARLASALGRDTGVIGKALSLARLPTTIIEAFNSPLEIQYRWAKPLTDRLLSDPENIIARARQIKATATKIIPAKDVFNYLVTEPEQQLVQVVKKADPTHSVLFDFSKKISIGLKRDTAATLTFDAQERPIIRFKSTLTPVSRDLLIKLLSDFLDKQA